MVVMWGTAGVFPQRVRQYAQSLPILKQHPRELLSLARGDSALVLVRTSWGNRVLADLWALGVKPGLAERAYRKLDTCDLDILRREALAGALTAASLTDRLEEQLATTPIPVSTIAGWPDPTVRLREGTTTDPRCVEELQRDLMGFTVVEPAMAWNDPSLRSGVVFARDMWERNQALVERYPGWQLWRYAPPADEPTAMPTMRRVEGVE